MGSLWANLIKTHKDGSFKELSPRWCIMGGGMDKGIYNSYFDCMRTPSLRVMFCLRAAYAKWLQDKALDLCDFFQSTRTDGAAEEGESPLPRLFCRQAPDFVELGADGKPLIAEVLVAMQGRVDSGRISGRR